MGGSRHEQDIDMYLLMYSVHTYPSSVSTSKDMCLI